ncbi:hypothetical protein D7Y13_26470 [Corallococcus praedator]|uniref:Uncharacterized protein n=1 Tax=Corallococcus praedator TaxID=2316724 RepID=A0ABX9QE04_9BACT|nr:hypothetical protein D7X74_21435 [Corallococcus sp. CA047B]RKH24327.1 hypothetical protein D7X75_32175 [Corallococcus sp. CA031C]RKI00740.1 hypothetical protein D7Y13_26470 [Corallococcus praedator]
MFVALAVPATVCVLGCTLPVLLGGPGLLSVATSAGPFAVLVGLALLVEVPLLTWAAGSTLLGRAVPLAVMVGMATVPWTLGLLGTEVLLERMHAALPLVRAGDAGVALTAGMGKAMAPRLLGAWTSAVLLGSLAVALAVARFSRASLPRGTRRGLLLASLVSAALAGMAAVGAMEAHHLFTLLSRLSRAPESLRPDLMAEGMAQAARLRTVRWSCLGCLSVLAFTWLRYRAREARRARTLEWAGGVVLTIAVGGLLVLDAHPLHTTLGPERVTAGRRTSGPVPTDADVTHLRGGRPPLRFSLPAPARTA